MKKTIPLAFAFAALLYAGVAYAQDAVAPQTPPPASTTPSSSPQPQISFPIKELGDCDSRDACKTYCDDSSHADACLSFAESHGLMKKEEVDQAKTLLSSGGPGGCKSGEECRAYCSDASHRDECMAFAQAHGITPPQEGEQRGTGTSTQNFQSGPDNQGPQGMNQQDQGPQIDESKVAQILAQKGGPGGCTTKDACRTYCSDSSHQAECLQFAEDNGLMSKDDAERAKTLVNATGPGGCKGDECKTYCEDQSHADACISFAEEHGFISKDKADQMRQMMQSGNGNQFPGQGETQGQFPGRGDTQGQFPGQGATEGQFPGGQGIGPNASGTPPCTSQEDCQKFFNEHRGEMRGTPQQGQFRGRGDEQNNSGDSRSQGGFPGQGATQGQFPGGPQGDRPEGMMPPQGMGSSTQGFPPPPQGFAPPAGSSSPEVGGQQPQPSAVPSTFDPSSACTQAGGSWNGTACIFPTSPASFEDNNNVAGAVVGFFHAIGL